MTNISIACRSVLETAEPTEKLMQARKVARDWRLGRLAHEFDTEMPDRLARPAAPELLPPNQMPKRKKAGSEKMRVALLHALAHIEFVAIDLAFDMAGRFGNEYPRQFVDDWLSVGADEAMHFAILNRRLKQLGSHYGAMPAHDGLWEAAEATSHESLARLAVVPMVLEARGLDITPSTVERFIAQGDSASAAILNRIYNDEIRHVSVGTRWFKWGCAEHNYPPAQHWQNLVKLYFRGSLKPPFNDSAREASGLTQDFYKFIA